MKKWKELLDKIEKGMVHLRNRELKGLYELVKKIDDKYPELSKKVHEVQERVEIIEGYIRNFKEKT